jgi:prolipoprotein diacylglyceryltransferase
VVPVYPTPLYEALMGLILFAVLWKFLRPRVKVAGNMFAWYMVLAGLERFAIEFIREHGTSIYKVGSISFSQAQMISVLLMVLGGAWLLLSKKIVKSQPAVA